MLKRNLARCYNQPAPHQTLPSASFNCQSWVCHQVIDWLKGLGESNAPYLRNFWRAKIDGQRLLTLDSDSLTRIGIAKESTRNKLLHAISLVSHYSYEVPCENLQKLAMDTRIAVGNLFSAVAYATPIINNPACASRYTEVLAAVLRSIADAYERVLKLNFWLDRRPFNDKPKFIQLRDCLSKQIDEMVDCVNNPNSVKFFSVPQVLVERGKTIFELCSQIVALDDPSVLYTAYLEKIHLRKASAAEDWGFDIGCTCMGMNVVTQLDFESSAGMSGKLEAGDEIVEVNGVTVIGWKQSNLLKMLNGESAAYRSDQQQDNMPARTNNNSCALELLLCRRPNDSWTAAAPPPVGQRRTPKIFLPADAKENANPEATAATDRQQSPSRLVMDFKRKIQTDHQAVRANNPLKERSVGGGGGGSLRRTRSSSFTIGVNDPKKRCERCFLPPATRCVSLLVPSFDKRPIFRRASVWNESPPATLRSPFDGLQSESNAWLLLLASWGGEGRSKQERLAEIHQHQRMPLTPTCFEAGNVSVLIEESQEEDDLSSSDDTRRWLDPNKIVYASVEVLTEPEMARLRLPSGQAMVNDPEWNGPIQDITGLKLAKRCHLESGSSTAASIIDSPLSTIHAKIAKFFYGDSAVVASTPSPVATVAPPYSEATTSSSLERIPEIPTCRSMPITPNSKASQDLPLFVVTPTATTRPSPFDECAEQSSCYSLSESPSFSSYSGAFKVKTVASRRHNRLAPLAEPDEIGDLSSVGAVNHNHRVAAGAVPSLDLNAVAKCQLGELAKVPYASHKHNTFEGWVRRQREPSAASSASGNSSSSGFRLSQRRESKWQKCWALLKDNLLYLYANKMATEADALINVECCSMGTSSDLKTTKKFVFSLCCDGQTLTFATYSAESHRAWLANLSPLVHGPETSTTTPNRNLMSGHLNNIRSSALFIREPSMEEPLEPPPPTPRSPPKSANAFNRIITRMSRRSSLRNFFTQSKSPTESTVNSVF